MRCLATCPGACSESASELGIKPRSPETKLQNQFSLQDVNPSSASLSMEFPPLRLLQALVRLGAALSLASQFLLCFQRDVTDAFQPLSCLHFYRGWCSAPVLTLHIQQFSGHFGILEEESRAHALSILILLFCCLMSHRQERARIHAEITTIYHRINPLLG